MATPADALARLLEILDRSESVQAKGATTTLFVPNGLSRTLQNPLKAPYFAYPAKIEFPHGNR
jgi:hypothetical protein